ncbi:MAG TPA: SCO family protein [Acidimicrobiales bacterium]|nr:SCO family protein [Acidimicrobiales bacterium]
MGGMGMGGGGPSPSNPVVVSAFHTALLHQGLIVVLLALFTALAWNVFRAVQVRPEGGSASGPASSRWPEPTARRVVRIGLGILWVADGALQLQAAMPLGMVSQVIKPAASGSPAWVQHLLVGPENVWTYHPVVAAAATVWIQLGIGVWLLVAPRGVWSRLGGVAGVAWGGLVWVVGEAFGGIFGAGLSWTTGAPGSALVYVAAGALVALPEAWWVGPRLGRVALRVGGVFFLGMALLQAWPGRGWWIGDVHGRAQGQLTQMAQQMTQTPQPPFLSQWLAAWGRLTAAHGFAVNLVIVVALALVGAGLVTAKARPARAALVVGVVLCLADWVLVQDLGVIGGVGTDPNSMLPIALVITAAYLALVRPASPPPTGVAPISSARLGTGWRQRLLEDPAPVMHAAAGIGALAITLVGVVPMAVASASPHADPVLAESIDGTPSTADFAAPAFTLTDQAGRSISSTSLRGKTVALTFLDDTCTSDCPVIAQEFRVADQYLGRLAGKVEMVAINANPRFTTRNYLSAFDQQEDLAHLPNWRYLTGSLRQLRAVWKAYGQSVVYEPAGAMIAHSENAWVIDPAGRVRAVLSTDPGGGAPGTSSFVQLLANTISQTVRGS